MAASSAHYGVALAGAKLAHACARITPKLSRRGSPVRITRVADMCQGTHPRCGRALPILIEQSRAAERDPTARRMCRRPNRAFACRRLLRPNGKLRSRAERRPLPEEGQAVCDTLLQRAVELVVRLATPTRCRVVKLRAGRTAVRRHPIEDPRQLWKAAPPTPTFRAAAGIPLRLGIRASLRLPHYCVGAAAQCGTSRGDKLRTARLNEVTGLGNDFLQDFG